MAIKSFVLTTTCINKPGIVASLSRVIFELGCNIEEAQQFDDAESGKFFARIVFHGDEQLARGTIHSYFRPVFDQFNISFTLREVAEKKRVLLLASRSDHCLGDLLYRWRSQELKMDVVAIASNHPKETYHNLNIGQVPFFHFPIRPETKPQQEAQILKLIDETSADLIVLARYMQILSNELAQELSGKCINIHHSFLPGFKGAKPYHQAHKRGVKLIGATAHYVTADLDEGPIIEQDVERITHRDMPEDLVRKGRDIERRVLARAVRSHLEDRVLLNGQKTIIFRE